MHRRRGQDPSLHFRGNSYAEGYTGSIASTFTLARIMTTSGCVGQVGLRETPVFVASPRVERSMVAGFEAGIVDQVVLDDVPAPGAVTDANACAWHLIDVVMRDGNPLCP